MTAFLKGFRRGVGVSPWAYFFPVVAVWRLFYSVFEEMTGEQKTTEILGGL